MGRRPGYIEPAKPLPGIPTPNDIVRFLAKVRLGDVPMGFDTPCWLWTASTDSNGYGRFKIFGENYGAQRVAWTMFRGPIPEGKQIDHLCHCYGCVNLDHQRPETQAVNSGRTSRCRRVREEHPAAAAAFAGDDDGPPF